MNDDYRKQPQKTAAAALNKVNKYNSINIHNKTVMGESEKAETKQHRSINLKITQIHTHRGPNATVIVIVAQVQNNK